MLANNPITILILPIVRETQRTIENGIRLIKPTNTIIPLAATQTQIIINGEPSIKQFPVGNVEIGNLETTQENKENYEDQN